VVDTYVTLLKEPVDPTAPKTRVIRLNIGGVNVDAQVIVSADALGNLDIPRTFLMDDISSATYTYFGEAVPGSVTSAAVWQLSQMTKATGDIYYAAAGAFSQIWDNRTSVIYA
jgi:hypothetical protein